MHDSLQVAVEHHQCGRLQDAARLYQAVLARAPEHPEALHLLGVVAHQLGQHRRAAELIGRAVVLRPDDPTCHANLAEVWRALGRPDRAADCCRAALRLRPDYPEAANNLGLALLQGGDAAGAVEQFRHALALRPDFAMAHNNLADALRARGEEDAAIEHFRRAVQCDPQLAEAHTNLGQLLCERRQLPEAVEHCGRAVQLRPDLAEAHSNLGNVMRALGRLDEARRHYAEALRLNPHVGMFHNNVAQLLQEEERYDEALAWYRQALSLDPDAPRIHCNLAGLLAETDCHEEAAAHYEAALRQAPRRAEAHAGLGLVRREQGRYQEAKQLYLTALEIKPGLAPASCGLGALLEEMNDLPGAESHFRATLRRDPTHAGALAQLATLLRGKLPDDDLAALRRRLAEPGLRGADHAGLHFGLAQVLDGRGQYAEAAEHLRRANALALAAREKRGETYDPGEHAGFVSGMLAACTPAFFERVRGLGLESERPVFIFGLPRSGTTLLEQILASHSQVFGAGELRLAREHFQALPDAMGSPDPPLACLGRLGREAAQAVGRRHLERLHALDATALRVVDKMPDNYLYLGLLAALFPRGKFIHCRRDLRDVAVSCWMTNFRQIRWANDPEHIAARFAEYRRVMEHWRATLPVPVLEVPYEDTVADLQGVARRLVAWCGLEWEPACLEFHKAERPVRTASVTQVRQPLYTRSVARWKHYEPALGGLFAKLGSGPLSAGCTA